MNEDFQKTVGLALKLARQKAGLSQQEVADRSGMKQIDVSNIENGKRNISLDIIQRFSKAVGMEPEFILKDSK
jgi:transcriptional regulator with XRE-family HTH domain